MCPSPVTLSPGPGSPPSRSELLAEADASAQMGQGGIDAGGLAAGGATGEAGAKKDDGNVVDAEFTEVKDKKAG